MFIWQQLLINPSTLPACQLSGSLGLGTLGSSETVYAASFAEDGVRCWNEIRQVGCRQWQELTSTASCQKLTVLSRWHFGFSVAGPVPLPRLQWLVCTCALLLSGYAAGNVNACHDSPRSFFISRSASENMCRLSQKCPSWFLNSLH